MKDRPGVVSSNGALMGADEPPPVTVLNPSGISPLLLIGDHAGNAIPRRLGALGLSEADRVRHIAWDIGVGGLGERLAERLDAVFVRQHYSRLVIDCNRDPASAEAIPEVSDGSAIPGNRGLSDRDRDERVRLIHAPYQQAIAAEIARRGAAGQATVLVSLHSFTPAMGGVARPWHVGILHGGGDPRFARALLAELERLPVPVGDNQPYRMDATDHTVPRHAFPGGIPYAEIEVRQDLLGSGEGIDRWSDLLGKALAAAAGS